MSPASAAAAPGPRPGIVVMAAACPDRPRAHGALRRDGPLGPDLPATTRTVSVTVRSLKQLFEPERIVWVGPVGPVPRWGRAAEANLWSSGFKGTISALRSTGLAPAEARIDSPKALPGAPFLGVICLPQPELPQLLEDLAAGGCQVVIIIGGGSGPFMLDPDRREAVRATTRRLGMRVFGPDRVGVIVPRLALNAGSAATMPLAGDLAFVTQSDSIATAMLDWAAARHLGFSRVVSLGDSADVRLGDILDYLTLDLTTRAVLVHLEGIADARRFMSAARACARVKPVIAIKPGRQSGMAMNGKGQAGPGLQRDRVYDAAFTRAGIVRVGTIDELFAAAASLGPGAVRRGHGLRGGRLALLTNGHAPAELAIDVLLAGGGEIAPPSARIYGDIARSIGVTGSLENGIDLGLEAGPDAYAAALDILLDAPEGDAVLVIHAPAAGVAPDAVAEAVAGRVEARKPRSAQLPVLAAWLGERSFERAQGPLKGAAIPAFAAPEPAVLAFLHRVHYERRQFILRQTPSSRPDDFVPRPEEAAALAAKVLAEGRRTLNEAEAMTMLDAYGIANTPTRLAADLDQAVAAAREIGYPVALKIISTKLPQKSAAGGVALDVENEASLLRRGHAMLDRIARNAPGVAIEGLLVQRMERSLFPMELQLALEVDPTFGPILLLGPAVQGVPSAGFAYFLPPLDATLAQALLAETPIGRFLKRREESGLPRVVERVVETLVRLSQLAIEIPTVQRAVIDPFLVSRDRAVVLDAHIDLAPVPPGADPSARLAIRPYPRELEQTATLRDGRTIHMRPIRPEDAPALKHLFESLTPRDLRLRLFSAMHEISDEFAARLTQIDYDREMVLVALDPENPGEFLAGARIAADPDNRRAEYSVTVRSNLQGLGLGRLCFERVLDYARARGIEEIWGSVLAENKGMLALAERLGFKRRRDPDAAEVFITTKSMR